MRELVIKRSEWRRGAMLQDHDKWGSVALLNDRGKMCCLGFDALACGVPIDAIRGFTSPEEVPFECLEPDVTKRYAKGRVREGSFGIYHNSDFVNEAMEINDDSTISDEQREARLIPLLKRIGGYDKVTFID